MAQPELDQKLNQYLQEAHAMEESVLRTLDSMISTTEDPEVQEILRHHRLETERHEQSVRERLEARGAGPSKCSDAQAVIGARGKGSLDKRRGDKPVRNARDGFVTEHLEIAAYEVLERVAIRAGDTDTAEVARRNRRDEVAMAEKIAASWDKVVELALVEGGAVG